MKRVLLLSGLQIYPPLSGGQIRSSNFCRSLVRLGYEVKIYSFTGRKIDYLKGRKSFAHHQDQVEEVVNLSPFFGGLQWLSYKLNLPPVWLTLLALVFRPEVLKNLLRETDILVLDFPFLYPIGQKFNGEKWLLSHNVEFELWKESSLLKRLVRVIELNAMDTVDKILFSSGNDKQTFSRLRTSAENKSFLVPHGVDLSMYNLNLDRQELRNQHGIGTEKKVFLFTGSTYAPNQVAFEFLKSFSESQNHFLIKNNILILVVGTVSEVAINEPQFRVMGKVDKIEPYLLLADFALNPITDGSGVNVKMLEYIAARLPILSTDFGTRGLKLEDKISYLKFSKESFLEMLIFAAGLSGDDKRLLAQNAFNANESQLDMQAALKGCIEERVESL